MISEEKLKKVSSMIRERRDDDEFIDIICSMLGNDENIDEMIEFLTYNEEADHDDIIVYALTIIGEL